MNIRNPHTESYEPAFIDEENGIDGVFVEGEVPEGVARAAIVKKPNQIKSATENNGEFSKENNDISFSVRRNSGYTEMKNGQAISKKGKLCRRPVSLVVRILPFTHTLAGCLCQNSSEREFDGR